MVTNSPENGFSDGGELTGRRVCGHVVDAVNAAVAARSGGRRRCRSRLDEVEIRRRRRRPSTMITERRRRRDIAASPRTPTVARRRHAVAPPRPSDAAAAAGNDVIRTEQRLPGVFRHLAGRRPQPRRGDGDVGVELFPVVDHRM